MHTIPASPFADDDGSADPALAEALAAWSRDPAAEPRLIPLLARARLLVPVVAVLGEVETGDDGLRREKNSDMAVLTLSLPDGRRTLPVFTATAYLARWRPDARPVAVSAQQALQAAVQEGAGTLVLDLGGPVEYEVRGRALRALATGGAPVEGPEVAASVRAVLAAEPTVRAAGLVPGGDGADGTLALLVDPADADDAAGAAPDGAVRETVTRIAHALATDPVLRGRLVYGLQLALLPPGSALPAGEPLYRRAAAD